eukprot:gnl/MRDRNA2_/MRDRNA2_98990_c0_seq1.p1 gnl/MRDRNA2_/MRDRNA2_98990_c0~~gnl/MRDRNA2_/MRDRNA2_98990_c0_seq1.p1  ORF type:complete len:281 (+),score=50.24 gnl/MRDRNA2_/MRDRNA2_98990_c0_seq1:66-908(+)
MVSLAQCQHILAEHPRIHPQSLAAKEYKRLGLGSLPFLNWILPRNENKIWEYQKQHSPKPKTIIAQAPVPAPMAVRADEVAPPSTSNLLIPVDIQTATVDHAEAQAQEQISTQINALGIRGLDALVFIFLTRHGTLESVFDYMDANNSGQVSLNAWTVCLRVMHIHLQELVGMAPNEIFGMIDTHNSSTISKNEFLTFFQPVQQGISNAKGDQPHSIKQSALGNKDTELKAIEEEEANLLGALGSLEQKLVGNADQPKRENAEPIARKARPPRPKSLKLR